MVSSDLRVGNGSSSTTRTPRVKPATWYVAVGSADVRWRCEMPAKHVGAKLVKLTEKQAKKYWSKPNTSKIFPWALTEDGAEYPLHEGGTAVWTRPCMVRATHAAAMAANGVRVIAEVDDNYLSNPSQNIFMRQNKFGALGRRSHMQAFATMDGIICSTEWLRDEYHDTFKKELKYVPELFVARNHVDPGEWASRTPLFPEDGRLRVGWMGSHQHVWDLRLAAPALHLAKSMGAEIVLIGLDPAEHDPKWKEFLGDYTHIPWFDPHLYHKTILNFDIGIIPLVYNKHTLGKSDVKFLEYAMSGAATVAQNNPVYNKTIVHGETGLLAGGPDEMAFAVADLIRNVRYRKELARAAKEYVLGNRTIQGNIHEWRDAIFAS